MLGSAKIFSQSVLVTQQWDDHSLYCIEQLLSLHLGLFRPNSMSIRAITFEQRGAKETFLLAGIKLRKSRLCPELESFG